MDYISQHFTTKRYTLTDLKEKKIAVFLKSEEEFKRISPKDNSGWMYGCYFGYENGQFTSIDEEDLPNYTKLSSIDEIDLGDEGKGLTMEDFIEPIAMKAGDKRVLVNGLVLPVDFRIISEDNYKLLESEIDRLKGDNEMLKSDLGIMVSQFEILQLRESPQISQDLEKRERMAWELFMKYEHLEIDRAFELTDTFLAKSKEVGNG
jgi:hypothetical protein